MRSRDSNASYSPDQDQYARRPMMSGAEAYWRVCLRLSPALADPTYINDTIRREHSPPRTPHV